MLTDWKYILIQGSLLCVTKKNCAHKFGHVQYKDPYRKIDGDNLLFMAWHIAEWNASLFANLSATYKQPPNTPSV